MAQSIVNPDFKLDASGIYLWQYEDATRLHAILNGAEEFFRVAVTEFWTDFRDKIFNIVTAVGFGLDLWGQILGVQRPTYTHDVDGVSVTEKISDDMYRRVLLGTLYKMNTNATLYDINHFLSYIFPDRAFVVRDNLDMTFTVFAIFVPTDEEKAVLRLENFLPRPAGVLCNFTYYDAENSQFWGFAAEGTEEELTQTYYGFKSELDPAPEHETGGVFIY